jgi:hypothetical protein
MGMTLVACNKPIFVSTSSSALNRRQIIVPFNADVPPAETRDLNAEFQPELPALARYLLSISDDWVTQTLKNQSNQGTSKEVWANLIRTEGLAAWVNDCVIFDSSTPTQIGSKKFNDPNQDPDDCKTLFESYTLYCHQNNYRQGFSKNNFSSELIELCQSALKWNVEKRSGKNNNTIECLEQGLGLRLRHSKLDVQILTIESSLESPHHQKETPVETWWRPGGDLVETSVETSTEVETFTKKEVQEIGGDGGDLNGNSTKKSFSSVSEPPETEKPIDIQIATQTHLSDDDILEMIEDLCRCEDKEMLMVLSKTYGFDDPQVKQRVWKKMSPTQQDKVKAIAFTMPNGVEVGMVCMPPIGQPVKLLEIFEETTGDGYPMLMGRCEYLSDGQECEVRLTMLNPIPT